MSTDDAGLERLAIAGAHEERAWLLRAEAERLGGTREALLARVLAEPDQDLPRLALGRWLADQGDPRGELIDVQVRLARRECYASERYALREREGALLEEHVRAWVAPLGGLPVPPTPAELREAKARWRDEYTRLLWTALRQGSPRPDQARPRSPDELTASRVVWRRGFVVEIALDAGFLDRVAAAFDREPIERLFVFGCTPIAVDRLVAAPWAGRLRGLKLRSARAPSGTGYVYDDCLGDAGARAIAAARALASLTRFNLGDCEIGPEGAAALAASPTLTRLEHLSLSGNRIGDAGARALAASPHLARLRSLWLARTGISADGVDAIAASPTLAGLERLGLGGNGLGPDAEAQARWPSGLRWVEV